LLAEENGAKSLLESPALEIVAKEMAQDQTRSLLGQRLGFRGIMAGISGPISVISGRPAKIKRPPLQQSLAASGSPNGGWRGSAVGIWKVAFVNIELPKVSDRNVQGSARPVQNVQTCVCQTILSTR
jgi:hypothetical protein